MTISLPSPELLEPFDEGLEPNIEDDEQGDGYKRVEPRGINPVRRKFSLRWAPMDPAQANALKDTLAATNFSETITWTPTSETQERKLRLTKLSIRWVGTTERQVSATLEDDF